MDALGRERQRQRADDAARDLVLNGENVVERPIEPLRPQVAPAGGVDQLRRHPDPLAGLANAAFKHVADAKLARDIGDRHGAAFEDEGRVARDHVQTRRCAPAR